MSDLQQRYAQIQKALNHGCHDRSCVIEKTTGMVTNGGCDCLRDLSFVDRQRVGHLLLLGQEAIAQLAEAEANCDAELTAALMASEERHKADKLAAMERVREAAAMEFDGWDNVPVQMTYDEARCRIRDLDLDALAEGEK